MAEEAERLRVPLTADREVVFAGLAMALVLLVMFVPFGDVPIVPSVSIISHSMDLVLFLTVTVAGSYFLHRAVLGEGLDMEERKSALTSGAAIIFILAAIVLLYRVDYWFADPAADHTGYWALAMMCSTIVGPLLVITYSTPQTVQGAQNGVLFGFVVTVIFGMFSWAMLGNPADGQESGYFPSVMIALAAFLFGGAMFRLTARTYEIWAQI